MKEKIIFPLVIILTISIFLTFLVIALKKDKAYLGGGLSVKKNEQPILFWLVVLFYIFIILPLLALLLFFFYINFLR